MMNKKKWNGTGKDGEKHEFRVWKIGYTIFSDPSFLTYDIHAFWFMIMNLNSAFFSFHRVAKWTRRWQESKMANTSSSTVDLIYLNVAWSNGYVISRMNSLTHSHTLTHTCLFLFCINLCLNKRNLSNQWCKRCIWSKCGGDDERPAGTNRKWGRH
jgi:hypothetical protein